MVSIDHQSHFSKSQILHQLRNSISQWCQQGSCLINGNRELVEGVTQHFNGYFEANLG